MNQIQLFNSSSNGKVMQICPAPEQIKSYFQAISRLRKSGKEFPVNLDEVWALVYARRNEARRGLTENFIEGIDFILLRQNTERKGRGGHNKTDYKISISCLEYFIARKVRAVFEFTVKYLIQLLNFREKF